MNYVIFRYANVYGPRQNPFGEAGVVAIFSNKLLRNEIPVINGNGKQTRDYVFVGDVVKANKLLLNHDASDIYNIGTGIETNVNEIFHKLNEISGKNFKEQHAPPPKGEQLRSVISSEKMYITFNWKPSVSIDEGLKKTYDYFKSNR